MDTDLLKDVSDTVVLAIKQCNYFREQSKVAKTQYKKEYFTKKLHKANDELATLLIMENALKKKQKKQENQQEQQ